MLNSLEGLQRERMEIPLIFQYSKQKWVMQHVLLYFAWISIQYLMTLNISAHLTFQVQGKFLLSYQLRSQIYPLSLLTLTYHHFQEQ